MVLERLPWAELLIFTWLRIFLRYRLPRYSINIVSGERHEASSIILSINHQSYFSSPLSKEISQLPPSQSYVFTSTGAGWRLSSTLHHKWLELSWCPVLKNLSILHFQLTALTSQQYRAYIASNYFTPCPGLVFELMVEHCLMSVQCGSGTWKKLQMKP